MSLISNILSKLKKRGAGKPPVDSAIAEPSSKSRSKNPFMSLVSKILPGRNKVKTAAPLADESIGEPDQTPKTRNKFSFPSFLNKVFRKRGNRKVDAAPDAPFTPAHNSPDKYNKAVIFAVAGLVLASIAGGLWLKSRPETAPSTTKVATKSAEPVSEQPTSPPTHEEAAPAEDESPVSTPTEAATQEALPEEPLPTESLPEETKPQSEVTEEIAPTVETAAPSPAPQHEAEPVPAEHVQQPVPASKPKHKNVSPPAIASSEHENIDETPESSPLSEGSMDKRVKPLTVQEQADNEFRKANGLMQQGRVDEAQTAYETALQLDADHDAARQALVSLLLGKARNSDAEKVLQDGLNHNLKQSNFAMLLARIQLERDASWSALLTLQKTLPYAERQPDYQAFVAALLQRLNRHKEAVAHYQIALQLSPNSGVWWMGLGISLQTLQHNDEARAAFERALATRSLNADLQAYVSHQLRELR